MTNAKPGKSRVVIVGAGISGLSLGYFLKKSAGEEIELAILEASGHAGGTIGTLRENGYLLETGPNGFVGNRLATWGLINRLGLRADVVQAGHRSRHKYVYHAGKLHRVPLGPLSLLGTPLFSAGGKLRLLAEPFVPPPKKARDEPVSAFFLRRIGREAFERAADPVLSGIYAGSSDELSAEAVFPNLVRYERRYGSVLKGFLSERPKNRDQMLKPLYTSFRNGMETLVQALEHELNPAVKLGTRVTGLRYHADTSTFTVQSDRDGKTHTDDRVDMLVLAVPAYAGAELLAPMCPELADTLREIPYAPVHVAALGYSREAVPHPLDGFGFLVSKNDRSAFLGSTWSSSVFPNRAPEGKVLLTCFLGGAEPASADALVKTASAYLDRILKTNRPPEFSRVFTWPRGIPQYTLGHTARIARLDQFTAAFPGLFITGNAYRGPGTNDCVEESERLAARITKAPAERTGRERVLHGAA